MTKINYSVAESHEIQLVLSELSEVDVDQVRANVWGGVDIRPSVGHGVAVRLTNDDGQINVYIFEDDRGHLGAQTGAATFRGVPAGVVARFVKCYLAV